MKTEDVDLGTWLAKWDGRQWAVGPRRATQPNAIYRPRYFTGLTAPSIWRQGVTPYIRDASRRDKGIRLPLDGRDAPRASSQALDLFTEEDAKHQILDAMEASELRASYLVVVRGEMRRRASRGSEVDPDEARAFFESLNPPEDLSRNFLACVFRGPEWEACGTYKSQTANSHANELKRYRLREIP